MKVIRSNPTVPPVTLKRRVEFPFTVAPPPLIMSGEEMFTSEVSVMTPTPAPT